MTWACTTGGADCSDTNKGRACYNPTSLRAQASFAFNDSFQRSKQVRRCTPSHASPRSLDSHSAPTANY